MLTPDQARWLAGNADRPLGELASALGVSKRTASNYLTLLRRGELDHLLTAPKRPLDEQARFNALMRVITSVASRVTQLTDVELSAIIDAIHRGDVDLREYMTESEVQAYVSGSSMAHRAPTN